MRCSTKLEGRPGGCPGPTTCTPPAILASASTVIWMVIGFGRARPRCLMNVGRGTFSAALVRGQTGRANIPIWHARTLMISKKSLRAYQLHHRQLPARLVIMKTSRFEKGEAEGFAGAIEEAGVAMTDMLWVSEGGHVMLIREGDYPSLRGSFVQLGENGLLYTRGSVPYYGTYPGARVPRPLHLRPTTARRRCPLWRPRSWH